MTISHTLQSLQRFRPGLLIAALLSLILGARIYVGVRCLAEIPQGDDGQTIVWLQNWSQGVHDWSQIWRFHNGSHPMELYYLSQLGEYLLNGYWDGRIDFLVATLLHTLYAAVVFWTFRNLPARRDRRWVYSFIFLLFAVPLGGYRAGWGLLWPNTAVMVFALPAIYLTAYHRQNWAAMIAIFILSGLAAMNFGAGCLCALLIVSLIGLEALLARRINVRDVVLAVACLAIFLAVYLNVISEKRPGAPEALDALLKALSWPASFVPGAGWFILLPMLALVAVQFLQPRFRSRHVTFVTGVSGLAMLIAIATGAFRGENNNMGMPSGRYLALFLILPLVTAVTLCLLYRQSAGRWRVAVALFSLAWLVCQLLGFSIQTVYRAVPFLGRETAEWNEAQKQMLFRDIVRGRAPVPTYDSGDDETLGFPAELNAALNAHGPPPAITAEAVAGFDLQPGSQGNYVVNGQHPSYEGRPSRVYHGSFDRNDLAAADRSFVSGVFRPQAPYITTDVLVDKKARFSKYRLDGLQLTLRDETDGSRTELLPRLTHTFPFILRDWEWIYAKVTPGHDYRIESHDTSPTGWLAFSEPLESGRLTPLVIGLCQSGKLLCLTGLSLLALVAYLRWLGGAAIEGETGFSPPSVTVL